MNATHKWMIMKPAFHLREIRIFLEYFKKKILRFRSQKFCSLRKEFIIIIFFGGKISAFLKII